MRNVLSWLIVILFFALVMSINTTRIDMTGGLEAFFDFTKWEDVTYWVQLFANTLFLVMLYATILLTRKNKLIENSEEIEQERAKLFNTKNDIINKNKRSALDDYLELVVNTDEKLEQRSYRIEKRRKWFVKFKMKKSILRADAEIEKITKYRTALRSDIDKLKEIDLNIHRIARAKKPVTFDSLFDIMDYAKPNRKIRIGYSDSAEARKLIAKSPITSLLTVFLSILAFGNVLTINSDWKSVALIMGSVTVAALLKWYNALKDAETIAKNKRRALAKANDEVGAFNSYKEADLKKLRDILFYVPEKAQDEVEVKDVQDSKKFVEGDTYTACFLPMIAK